MTKKPNEPILVDQRYLKGVLSMLVHFYAGEEKIEIVLARCGFNYNEIAEVTNKKPDAVRMFLKRHRNRVTKFFGFGSDAA